MKESPCLVVGASGLIGHILWSKLPPDRRYGTFYSYPVPGFVHLDIRDAQDSSSLVRDLSPSVIFQTAALPNVDWCEEHPEECWAMNVLGTVNLARAATDVGAKFIFFSTDYVFDGKDGPYSETDEPSPINVYGKAKLAAEKFIQEQLEDFLIVRVMGVYGWEQRVKNFVMWLLDRNSKGQAVKVPMDQIGSPAYADNMLDVVLDLVNLNQRGVFHVAGSQLMDRYTFACIVSETFNLDQRLLVPVATKELGQKAARPLKAGLHTDHVQSLVSTKLLGPHEGLRLMKEQGNPFISSAFAAFSA